MKFIVTCLISELLSSGISLGSVALTNYTVGGSVNGGLLDSSPN
jgi:hypothetical protein